MRSIFRVGDCARRCPHPTCSLRCARRPPHKGEVKSAQQLAHRAVRLVDGDVGIGGHAGIGIGDGDAAERLRATMLGRVGVESAIAQRIVFRRIAVRPAVDGDAFDVARRIEAAGPRMRPSWSRMFSRRSRTASPAVRRGPPCAVRARGRPGCAGVRIMRIRIGCVGIARGSCTRRYSTGWLSEIDEDSRPARRPGGRRASGTPASCSAPRWYRPAAS